MAKPAVSVVVPLYNKAAYIRRCLESIRCQTFSDFEVIVIDDGSADGSADIAGEIDDSRFQVVSQENRGEGAARNSGIQHSKADLIAFLDADDAWEKGFLEAIVSMAASYPEAGWFATGYRRAYGLEWDREVTVRQIGERHTRLVTEYLAIVRAGDIVTSSSVALRRAVLEKVGGFPEGEPIGADQDLWVRVAAFYALAYDTRILAVYHSEATGRASNVQPIPPVYPSLRSARRLLASATLPAGQRRNIIHYIDWLTFKRADIMLYGGDPLEVDGVLQAAHFLTMRFRVKAMLVRIALKTLPMRIIGAVRYKPVVLLWQLRRIAIFRSLIRGVEALSGSILVLRAVRAPNRRGVETVSTVTAPSGTRS